VPVTPTLDACTQAQIGTLVTACLSSTATNTACNTFFAVTANQGCAMCLVAGVPDAGSGTGALVFDYTDSYFIDVNWGGCVALEDPTNGPACAQAFEPLDQCNVQACGLNQACNTQSLYDTCIMGADAPGAACGAEAAAMVACQAYEVDGGALVAGKCSTYADVVNVICGTGP
jgi:hypothetical protein